MIPTPQSLFDQAATGQARLTFDVFVNGETVTANLGALSTLEASQNELSSAETEVDRLEEEIELAEEEIAELEGLVTDEPSESLTESIRQATEDLVLLEEALAELEADEQTAEDAVEAAEAQRLTSSAEFVLTGGSIVQDMSRPVRRNMSINFEGGLNVVPAALGTTWSPANRSKVRAYWRSATASSRYFDFIMQGPSFGYDIDTGVLTGTITAVDRLGWLSERKLGRTFQVSSGDSPELAVYDLLRLEDGITGPVALTAKTTTLKGDVTFGPEDSILKVVTDLAAEGGFEVRTTPQGRLLIAYPLLAGRRLSVHSITENMDYLVGIGRTVETNEIVNGAIVTTNNLGSDDVPGSAEVWITSGELAYTGPVGPRPVVAQLTETSQAELTSRALQLLDQFSGSPDTITLVTRPNPRFEIGDGATVSFPSLNLSGSYVVQRVAYSLGADTMTTTLVPKA